MITRGEPDCAKTAKTGYGSARATALPLPYPFRYGSGSAGGSFDNLHDQAVPLGHRHKIKLKYAPASLPNRNNPIALFIKDRHGRDYGCCDECSHTKMQSVAC